MAARFLSMYQQRTGHGSEPGIHSRSTPSTQRRWTEERLWMKKTEESTSKGLYSVNTRMRWRIAPTRNGNSRKPRLRSSMTAWTSVPKRWIPSWINCQAATIPNITRAYGNLKPKDSKVGTTMKGVLRCIELHKFHVSNGYPPLWPN